MQKLPFEQLDAACLVVVRTARDLLNRVGDGAVIDFDGNGPIFITPDMVIREMRATLSDLCVVAGWDFESWYGRRVGDLVATEPAVGDA